MSGNRIYLVRGDAPQLTQTASDQASRPEAPASASERSVRPAPAGLQIEQTFVLEQPGGSLGRLQTRKSWMGLINVLIMLTMLLIVFLAKGEWSVSGFWQRSTSTDELTSPPRRPIDKVVVNRTEDAMPQLMIETPDAILGGHPARLGLKLQGRADQAIVVITGLARGMMLSKGSPAGIGAWQIPANDAVLRDAWIIPPAEFVGTVELVADLRLADGTTSSRRPVRFVWVALSPAIDAAAQQAGQQALPLPRQPIQAQRPFDPETIAAMVKRGRDLIASGDLAAARVVLQRAAEAGDADAAFALATTYDPVSLRKLKVYGLAPDAAKARIWYQQAKKFGSAEAPK